MSIITQSSINYLINFNTASVLLFNTQQDGLICTLWGVNLTLGILLCVLNWPANSPDLNPIENLWDIVKRKLRDARPNTLDELKAAIEASWASITPQQCHRLIASMPRRIEAVISAKGFPTKY